MLTGNNAPSFNPGALDSTYAAMEQIIADYLTNYLCTCIPVEVDSISETTAEGQQFVNVKPVLRNRMMNGQFLPITQNTVYYNIPMMTLFGNQCEISFQVSAGDKGLLIAAKHDISQYKETQQTADIPTKRMFSFSDGFFLPLDFQNKQEGVIVRNGETVLNLLPESITMTTKTVQVNAETATVTAQAVNLGGEGGQGIARLGDTVSVDVTSGSSAGTWSGTITSASSVSKSI